MTVLGWAAMAWTTAAAAPVTYRLDPAASWLYAVVYNDRSALASRLGHDHAFRPSRFDGTVTWDPADPSACRVSISFPVDALWPDPPGLREREGLAADGAVAEDSKATIVSNLQGRSQLDAGRYPTIAFLGDRCSGGVGEVTVTGTLTLHGVGREVTARLAVSPTPERFAASGTFRIRHSDFGFSPFTNLAGALRNQDEIKVVVDVQGPAAP
jgi:polyisoprenoid-binding protein YceI